MADLELMEVGQVVEETEASASSEGSACSQASSPAADDHPVEISLHQVSIPSAVYHCENYIQPVEENSLMQSCTTT